MRKVCKSICLITYDWMGGVMDDFLILTKSVIPNFWEKILMAIGATIGAWLSYIEGGFDEPLIWLFGFVCFDYFTGNAAVLKRGEWMSKKAFQGIFKKLFMFIMVAVCNGLDHALNLDMLRDACVFAYILNETGSILENIDRLGFGSVIPPFLRKALKILKEREQEKLMK